MPPDRPQEAPPPLGLVLRHYGPHLVALAALGLAAVAFASLHGRMTALEARVASLEPPLAPTVQTPATADWRCTGTLDQPAVLAAIGGQGRGVLACIDGSRARRPELEGTLLVRVRVGADGRVSDVKVAGVVDDELTTCVGHDVLTWTFPAPRDGACAIVEAPFAVGG